MISESSSSLGTLTLTVSQSDQSVSFSTSELLFPPLSYCLDSGANVNDFGGIVCG